MPNNYLSVLYKHIIQVENKNVGLKAWGRGGTNIPLPSNQKIGGGGGTCPPCPPLPTPVYICVCICICIHTERERARQIIYILYISVSVYFSVFQVVGLLLYCIYFCMNETIRISVPVCGTLNNNDWMNKKLYLTQDI